MNNQADIKLYDVVAVSLSDNSVLWVEEGKTRPNAEAIVSMAVMRQGVEDRFFSIAAHGAYEEDDTWRGSQIEDEPESEPEPSTIRRSGNMWYPVGPRGL